MAIRTTGVRYDLIARDSASRTFNSVGGSASKLEKGLGKLGKAAVAAGAALAGGIAVGLAESAKKAVEFQTQMTRIQTQAGASAKDVAVLSKQVLELGKSTQQGPQQLSEALYHLKSVGMDNVDAMKALRTASDLAAVGGANLEETTNALAGAWRTGIKGATNMNEAARTLNATIGAGNMTMEDMVAALGTGILPTAKTFGLTLSQVGAALALFTDEGVDSASAATRLRMSISLLAAPSKAAEKQLKKIGLTGNMLGNAMRSKDGIIAAISLLKDHLDKSGLSATQSAALLSRAFGGGKSSSAILSMVNNLDVLKKKQDQVNKSMDKFPAAVAAQRKTVQAQYDIIKSNLEVASIQIGTKLLPALASVTQYITKTGLPAVGSFSAHLRSLVPVKRIEGDFKTATGFVADFFNTLNPKKAKLPTPSLAMPTSKVPATLKAPTTQGQQLGKQLHDALTGGLSDAVDNIDWNKLGHQIGAGLDKGFGWITAHLKDIGDRMGKAIASVDWVDIGKKVGVIGVPFLIGVLDEMFTPLFTLKFWKKHWWDAIVAVLSVIPFDEVFNLAGRLLKALPWGKLGSVIGDGLARIPWGKSLDWAKYLGKAASDGWNAISRFSGQILDDFTRAFSTKFPKLSQWFTTQLDILPTRIGLIGLELKQSFGRALDGVIESIPGWKNKFVRFIYKYFTRYTMYQAGTQLVIGLYNGITDRLSGLGKWIKIHWVDPFVGAVKSLFGIHSPSTVFAGIGGSLVAGLYSGISSALAGIGKWVSAHIKSPVVHAIVKPSSWLTSPGRSLISGLLSGATAMMSDAKSGIGHWAGQVKSKVVGAIKSVFGIHSPSRVMAELGGHMMSGLMKGLLQGKDVLNATVKGLFHSPLDAAQTLLSNGVGLPGKWLAKLLGGKAPQGSDVPLGPGVASAQAYAAKLVAQMWPKGAAGEMNALRALWNAESGWRANAENMSSGAYGIPQALPASKMASAGSDWRTNAATQIRWGLSYIRSRYGDPETAWGSWNAHKPHWYAKGGLAQFGETAWVGERGPELMQVTKRGTRIYNNRDSMALAKGAGIKLPGYASGTVANAQARVDQARDALERARQRRIGIKAAETRLAAAKQELANAKRATKTSVANALSNGFLKALETGSASAIASAIKAMNTKLQAAGAGSLVAGNNRTSAKLQSLANQRSNIQSTIATAKQYASDQSASLGDFLGLSNIPSSSLSSLITRMQTSQTTASKFAAEVADLSKRGLDKNLLSQVAAAGPGSQLAALFSTATASDIAQLNKLAASQAKLTTSFGQSMADAMYDSGKDAGKGFLSGLQGQEKAIQAEMNKLAAGMVATIKKKLGIHSPSTVMRDQVGKQLAMGVAHGVHLHTPKAVLAAQRMADMTAAVRARSGVQGAPATRGGGRVVHHHHENHTHYEINARTADFSVPELELLQRRSEARQRVGRPR